MLNRCSAVRRVDQLVLAFVLLGMAVRGLRYSGFPLWEDECFLCTNLIDRDFRGLLEPLNFHQVVPVFFLWIQLAVVKVLGFNEWSLRLVPFLCGLGSLLLFWRLACRCLTGLPRLLAVAVFAVTYATIRYSAEAKPYGIDLFVVLLLITFTVNWLQQPGCTRWLWTLAATMPFAVGVSYGAVMLGGGLCLAIAFVILRQRRWESVRAWAVFTAALLASFGVFYYVCIRGQEASDLEPMRKMWEEHFPPAHRLPRLYLLAVVSAYRRPAGLPRRRAPAQSSLSALCWIVALVAPVRRQTGFRPALMPGAAGRHVRGRDLPPFPLWPDAAKLFHGAISLPPDRLRHGNLAGLAGRCHWKPYLGLGTALVLLASVAVGGMIRDVAGPYKSICDQRMRLRRVVLVQR